MSDRRTRRDRRLRAVLLAGLLIAVAAGCSRDSLVRPYHGSLDGLETSFDFVAEEDAARALAERTRVDVGSPGDRDALLEGWGEPELDSATGRTFSWAIATEASLTLELLRSGPVTLRFRCRPFDWDGAPAQRVEVELNGRRAGSAELAAGPGTYAVEVPGRLLRPGRNVVTFRFAWAEAPSTRGGDPGDQRTLAAAFDEVWIDDGGPQEPHSRPAGRRGTIELEPGQGRLYTLVADGDVVLDPRVSDEGSTTGLLAWVARPGGEPEVVLSPGGAPGPVTIRWPAGRPLSVGIAAAGGGQGAVIARPRLLSAGAAVRRASNLLLIVMDTLRADAVGAYGGAAATPVIDGLAARGTLFERAYTHIAITGPSHASLFTSLLPFEHGVRNNAQIMGEGASTLAECLQASGWTTSAVVSLGVLKREFGFAQGFGVYGDDFASDWMKDAGEVTSETIELVQRGLVEPYFLWVHYSDPHEPYTPPDLDYPWVDLELDGEGVAAIRATGRSWAIPLTVPPGAHALDFAARRPDVDPGRWYRLDAVRVEGKDVVVRGGDWKVLEHPGSPPTFESQLPASLELVNESAAGREVTLHVNFKQRLDIPEVRVRYLQEVEYADRQIGRLLGSLDVRGLLDDTLVVFASDHGEGLGYHNHVGHIHQVYDTLIKVPLILAYPGVVPEGLRVADLVGLVDVAPTVADLLGVPAPAPSSGSSLRPLLRGEWMAERPLVAQTFRPEAFTDKQAILLGGFKYIHSWSPERQWEELYDLAADPGELRNLIDERPDVADRLRAALAARLAAMPEGSAAAADLSDADRDRLRALGYVH